MNGEHLSVLATGRVGNLSKLSKNGRSFNLNVSRDYTQEDVEYMKQPIKMQCNVPAEHAMKVKAVEDGANIECGGIIQPVSYIWIPDGTKFGKRAIIPEVGETSQVAINNKKIAVKGRSRPWEVTAEKSWLAQSAMCQVSTFIVSVNEINSIESASSIDQLTSAIPDTEHDNVLDDNAIAAMLDGDAESELTDDPTITMTDAMIQKQEQIFVTGRGRLYSLREPIDSMNGMGNETVSRTFQLEVNLNIRDKNNHIRQRQPIRMRCTVWDNLVDKLEGARNGTPIEIGGFIDPWYILWIPNGDPRGRRIVIGEEGREHGNARPMDIIERETWNPNCHLQTTYQLTVNNVDFISYEQQQDEQQSRQRTTRRQARTTRQPANQQEIGQIAQGNNPPITVDPNDPLEQVNNELNSEAEAKVNV